VCFVVHKTISELEYVILTTLFLHVQKISTIGTPGKGICSVLFLYTFRLFYHRRLSSLRTTNTCHTVASPSVKPFTLGALSSSSTHSAA
jgi:hypothetical protein